MLMVFGVGLGIFPVLASREERPEAGTTLDLDYKARIILAGFALGLKSDNASARI